MLFKSAIVSNNRRSKLHAVMHRLPIFFVFTPTCILYSFVS